MTAPVAAYDVDDITRALRDSGLTEVRTTVGWVGLESWREGVSRALPGWRGWLEYGRGGWLIRDGVSLPWRPAGWWPVR